MTTPVPFNIPLLPFQAQELLARARHYRNVAMSLVDIDNGRPNWPKYTLLFHAIELALKAAIALTLTFPCDLPVSSGRANDKILLESLSFRKYQLCARNRCCCSCALGQKEDMALVALG